MLRSVVFTVILVAFASYAASTYLAGRVAKSEPDQAQPAAAPVQQQAQVQAPALQTPASGETVRGSGEIEIAADAAGNYLTNVEIDGYQVRMVVDTGATYVALTDADANAIGIRPAPADYRYQTQTANGTGVAAKVRLPSLRLGQMEITDVEAFVMPPGALSTSLLGMSALNRLGKVEMGAGRLILRQ